MLCKHYETLVSKLFAEFIENNFLGIFKSTCNPTGNVFVQDGDPSQNSKAAKTALDKNGVVQFSISLRSLDLNPIENTFNLVDKNLNAFNLVNKNLSSDAVKYSICKEVYAKFVERVENTLLSYPIELLIILSRPCRKEYHRIYRVKVII